MTPIWVPDTGVLATDIVTEIRGRLSDLKQLGTTTETADGTNKSFKMRDAPITGLAVTDDGTTTTAYSVDTDTGWVTFNTAPTDGHALVFTYGYYLYSDDHILSALNAAVSDLFGDFSVQDSNDTVLTTGEQEYVVQTSSGVDVSPGARVSKVEYWSDPHWVRIDGFSTRTTQTQVLVHFETAPASGYKLRFTWQTWPSIFSSLSDTLEDIGLPDRAKEPLELYAMSKLLGDRLGYRLRSDLGHNTQGENQVKSYEIQNDAAWYRSQAQLEAQMLRQNPMSVRIVS